MAFESSNLEVLSTRSGFNTAVRHIQKTLGIAGEKGNLGDILFKMEDQELTGARIGLLLRMFLIDKQGYKYASANLEKVSQNISKLSQEFQKWKGVDLVAAYHHPELGLLVANPKNPEELAGFGELRKHELIAVYAGLQGKDTSDKAACENCQKAAELAIKLFEGDKVTAPAALTRGNFTAVKISKPKEKSEPAVKKVKVVKAKTSVKKAPVVKAAALPTQAKAGSGASKMTPRYAVVVQNELFHNGNVEAWKRIIASYNAKHPDLEVFIYYEGERILDINSLFKWGKVKHGSAIEFAVAGSEIQDVAKLQRYLAQGSSHMFEAFLKGPVNTVLNLF